MAITSIKTGSSFTNLQKYNDFLGPNPAFIPKPVVTGGTLASDATYSDRPSLFPLRLFAKIELFS